MIFALDVGTGKIAGLISFMERNILKIVDVQIVEHESRVMFDGQIHDVNLVAEEVLSVKKALEERNETNLKEVAIALAGRYLKTIVGEAEKDLSRVSSITREDVLRLEIEALKDANSKLENEDLYCVGYSVFEYKLDGAWMKKLEGHKGGKAYVKIVSAFLPVHVVESMLRVLEIADLRPIHITLEPIAAMEYLVPPDMRLLNLALVDVGAGTSDIAISREGTIVAYGMIPLAGDEITEAIAQEFLLDFKNAEVVKRSLREGNVFRIKNVLDREVVLNREEIMDTIAPVIDSITSEIAQKILELNGRPPKAVMVIGGGAKVPTFIEKLAEKLELPEERVSLKSIENTECVDDMTGILKGSEFVTPVGIAYTAFKNMGAVFSRVSVNGVPIKLMGLNGRYSVMQVLLQAGYSLSEIVNESTVILEVNAKPLVKKVKGSLEIRVNGEKKDFDAIVKDGDKIEIKRSESVNVLKLKDVIEPIRVNVGGETMEIFPDVKLNSEVVSDPEIPLKDGDKLEFSEKILVSDLRKKLGWSFKIILNGEEREVKVGNVVFMKGEKTLQDNDEIPLGEELTAQMNDHPTVMDLLKNLVPFMEVTFNNEKLMIPSKRVFVKNSKGYLEEDATLSPDNPITVELSESKPIVADLLKRLDLGTIKNYEILKNGKKATFSEEIDEGDNIVFRTF